MGVVESFRTAWISSVTGPVLGHDQAAFTPWFHDALMSSNGDRQVDIIRSRAAFDPARSINAMRRVPVLLSTPPGDAAGADQRRSGTAAMAASTAGAAGRIRKGPSPLARPWARLATGVVVRRPP